MKMGLQKNMQICNTLDPAYINPYNAEILDIKCF